jgi:geranylgeranyl diphosphate synthase type I
MTMEALGPRERARFASRWGHESLAPQEVDELRGIVEASGARADTEKLVEELRSLAMDALDSAPIPEDARAELSRLASAAVDRTD